MTCFLKAVSGTSLIALQDSQGGKLTAKSSPSWAACVITDCLLTAAAIPQPALKLIGFILESIGSKLTQSARGLGSRVVASFPKGNAGLATRALCALIAAITLFRVLKTFSFSKELPPPTISTY